VGDSSGLCNASRSIGEDDTTVAARVLKVRRRVRDSTGLRTVGMKAARQEDEREEGMDSGRQVDSLGPGAAKRATSAGHVVGSRVSPALETVLQFVGFASRLGSWL
jgi:hypothetical protein